MSKRIKEAADNQSGNNEIYYYSEPIIKSDKNGRPNYQLVVAGDNNASDIVTLLRHLPDLYQDSNSVSEILSTLLSITAKQQMQIAALEAKLDEVVRANIAIQAQENINDVLLKLAENGCDVSRPEVIIKIAASNNNSSSEHIKQEKSSKEQQSRSKELHGQISGVAKLLAGLKVSYTNGTELNSEVQEILDRRVESNKSESYAGDVIIRFESISGSPIAKAKAATLKKRPPTKPSTENVQPSTKVVPKKV